MTPKNLRTILRAWRLAAATPFVVGWLWLAIGLEVLCQASPFVGGQERTDSIPIIEQEPFDVITLDETNGNIEIKIRPLAQPLPEPLPRQGFLIFDAPELSDERLQVPYSNITRYQSFNDLLKSEANQLIRQEDYGKAFRNLIYVYDHGGRSDPELTALIQNVLFRDGAKNYLSGNFELALSIFQDIYDRDPEFEVPGISRKPIDLILDCLDKNIESKLAASQFAQTRAAVDELEFRYREAAAGVSKKWRQRLLEMSDRLLAEAEQLAGAQDGRSALLAARRAETIFPGRAETRELSRRLRELFPIIFVGVSQQGAVADPQRLDDWGSLRIGRLTRRNVVEFVGPGDDGGQYEFLNGKLQQVDDNELVFRFTMEPPRPGTKVPALDAFELSRRLLSRGTVGSADYFEPFARVVRSVEIENERQVLLNFKRAFAKPEALFRFQYDSADSEAVENGLYVLRERNEQVSVYAGNPKYAEGGPQPPQIIEWKFPSATEAARALIAGEIDVLDRVHLADLNRLDQTASIEIGAYVVPTVHFLIPNHRNEFMQDRNFRNGLRHGINRELILREVLCGGRDISGCELISGPFPIGTEDNDQVSYAYNLGVHTEPFNDRLGMVLIRVIYETRRNWMLKQGIEDPQLSFPKIVLAHPDEETPRIACQNIQQMWEAMGLEVELRALKEYEVTPGDDEWDFLYYQIAMEEPLVDVDRVFGRQGVVKVIGAPAQQSMHSLGFANSWRAATWSLRQLHRQVVTDVSIIPLWQIREHFAYRDQLRGLGKNPVHLYERVGDWNFESEIAAN
jgi:hypothetical protein